ADGPAGGDRNLIEVLPGDISAGPHRAHFFLRHPDLAADRVAWALHLLLDDFAGAADRGAGARVVDDAAGQAAATSHDRAGDVLHHVLPVSRADLHLALGVNRLPRAGLVADHPRLRDGLVRRYRDLPAVLFVNRPLRAVANRDLVGLVFGAVGRVRHA